MHRILSLLIFITMSSVLAGCTSTATTEAKVEAIQLDGNWRVEDIDQGGVTDYAMLTMQFTEQGRITGSTGCNRYNASLQTGNGAFVVSNSISTRRACVPAIAKQEQQFLAALNDAARYEIAAQTWLVIYDASDKPRLKLIQMPAAPELADTHLIVDKASAESATFACEQLGMVGFRFLGSETVEISIGEKINVLQRDVAASGAKYSNAKMTFWNNGDDAQLSIVSAVDTTSITSTGSTMHVASTEQQHYQCHAQ